MIHLAAASGVARTSGLQTASQIKAMNLACHWTRMCKGIIGLPDHHPQSSAKALARNHLLLLSLSNWEKSDRDDFFAAFKRHCNVRDDAAKIRRQEQAAGM